MSDQEGGEQRVRPIPPHEPGEPRTRPVVVGVVVVAVETRPHPMPQTRGATQGYGTLVVTVTPTVSGSTRLHVSPSC